MPGFESRYKPANPFASVPTPWRENAAPVAHPYPDWKPSARGDASALLPYIDDDLREEPENPVSPWLSGVDNTHLLGDAAIYGDAPVQHLGEHASHVLSGETTAGRTGFGAFGVLASGASIAGGAIDLIEGYQQYQNGNRADGAFSMTEGGLNVVSGASGLAAIGGSTVAAATSVVAGTGALGLEIGHHGDKQVKKLGWLHDDDGHAVSASDWAANLGQDANDWMTERGHPILGGMAGGVALGAGIVAGTGMSLAAIPVSAGHSIGTSVAHDEREDHYEHYDVGIVGGAKSLADYDDAQQDAVQRSRNEHPERWGQNPRNPTYGQAFAQLRTQARGGQ